MCFYWVSTKYVCWSYNISEQVYCLQEGSLELHVGRVRSSVPARGWDTSTSRSPPGHSALAQVLHRFWPRVPSTPKPPVWPQCRHNLPDMFIASGKGLRVLHCSLHGSQILSPPLPDLPGSQSMRQHIIPPPSCCQLARCCPILLTHLSSEGPSVGRRTQAGSCGFNGVLSVTVLSVVCRPIALMALALKALAVKHSFFSLGILCINDQ